VRHLSPSGRWTWLFGVLAVGLGFRLLLAYVLLPDSGYWQDVALFASWAQSLAYYGPGRFYETAGFADYPAGFLIVVWLVGVISNAISADDVFLTRALIKAPAMLADVGIAFVAYLAIRRIASRRAALIAAAIYLINPVTWLDSALWGQNDALGTLALSLAVLGLAARQPELAALSGAAALLIKPQFAILAPLIIVVLVHRHALQDSSVWRRAKDGPLRLLTSAAVGLLALWLPPALFGQTPVDLVSHMQQQANLYPYASMSAFNPWTIFSLLYSGRAPELTELIPWVDDRDAVFAFVTPFVVGLALFAGACAIALWRLWRSLGTRDERIQLWACSSTIVFAFFVLATRMHERYAFPFFALALPLVVLSKRWLLAYAVATVGCWANIYAIYALSWVDGWAYAGPDLLTGALATPLGMAVNSAVNTVALLLVLWVGGIRRAGETTIGRIESNSDVGVVGSKRGSVLQQPDGGLVVPHPQP